MIRELQAAAARRGIALAQDDSVGRRIAVWENAGGNVSDLYRELLCEVYQLPAVELGLVDPLPLPAQPAGFELASRLTCPAWTLGSWSCSSNRPRASGCWTDA